MTHNDHCTVVGSFELPENGICEVLAFSQPGETQVGWDTITERGRNNGAAIDEGAYRKFWDNRDRVPPDLRGHCFLFPEAGTYVVHKETGWFRSQFKRKVYAMICDNGAIVRFS